MATDIPSRVVHGDRTFDLVSRGGEIWGVQLEGNHLGTLSGNCADPHDDDRRWLAEPESAHYEPTKPRFTGWDDALIDFVDQVADQIER